MKKTWIKRENIHYVPFYKQKSKVLLLAIFFLGIVCFVYQAISINQLPNTSTPWTLGSTVQGLREKHKQIKSSLGRKQTDHDYFGAEFNKDGVAGIAYSEDTNASHEAIKIIRGIRLYDYDSYKPNFEGKFRCLDSNVEIAFERVNDDYCDCVTDGSDEPSTNACRHGRFYCKYQKRPVIGQGRDIYIPSSRVNDAICDCCDGSDEWTGIICENAC